MPHKQLPGEAPLFRSREIPQRLARTAIVLGMSALAACGGQAGNGEVIASNPAEQTESTPSAPEAKEVISHEVTATVYWIGEDATADNDYISNVPSAWDSDAVERFGGIDSPDGRNFTPEHNTFYFALPAAEFTEDGLIQGAREASPWASEIPELAEDESLFKGRWVKLGDGVYAQWQDVGPNEEHDYDYVFGGEQPTNTFGERAGIDLSPDAANELGIDGSGVVTWEFVDEDEVPDGPWKQHPPIDNKTYWE
jgi:hypothetical protein